MAAAVIGTIAVILFCLPTLFKVSPLMAIIVIAAFIYLTKKIYHL